MVVLCALLVIVMPRGAARSGLCRTEQNCACPRFVREVKLSVLQTSSTEYGTEGRDPPRIPRTCCKVSGEFWTAFRNVLLLFCPSICILRTWDRPLLRRCWGGGTAARCFCTAALSPFLTCVF